MDAKRKALSAPSSLETAKRKALSLPLSSEEPPLRKLCLICRCVSSESDAYNIYILDINSSVESSIPRNPTLTVRLAEGRSGECRVDVWALCVLGSRLYIFEGCRGECQRKSVFMVELPPPPYEEDNLIFEKSVLEEAPHMHHPKSFPRAIPTPDGKKVVVFSTLIFVFHGDEDERDEDRCDFEWYDPTNRKWDKLPGIYDKWGDDWGSYLCDSFWGITPDSDCFRILNYTFIGQSVLFLDTEIGMFSLDLAFPDQGWKKLDSFYGDPRICRKLSHSTYFSVIWDGLCLTAFHAYDTRLSRFFDFPRRPSSLGDGAGVDNYRLTTKALTLLDVNDVECSFCIVHTQITNRDYSRPDLIVDVYRCDLIKYKEEAPAKPRRNKEGDSMPPGTSLVKSFKLPLNAQHYDPAYFLHLCTLGVGTTSYLSYLDSLCADAKDV